MSSENTNENKCSSYIEKSIESEFITKKFVLDEKTHKKLKMMVISMDLDSNGRITQEALSQALKVAVDNYKL